MDLATLRARLPGMTRGVFGELFNIRPMTAGKMGLAAAHPTRPPQLQIKGRFDAAPDLEQMGGGRERAEAARVSSEHTSVSFATIELTTVPEQGDEIDRFNPVTGAAEIYRVDRTATPNPGVLLVFLSRLKK